MTEICGIYNKKPATDKLYWKLSSDGAQVLLLLVDERDSVIQKVLSMSDRGTLDRFIIAPEYRHLLVTNVDGYVATAAEREEV